MPQFAVSIVKEQQFQGVTRRFGNVYHFVCGNVDTLASYIAIINRVKDVERQVHTPNVTFIEGRLWGPTGQGDIAATMRELVRFSGQTGQATSQDLQWYRELAYLIQWPLGRYGSKNRPQYLRKWIRPGGGLATYTDAQKQGTATITTPAAIGTYIQEITALAVVGDGQSPFNLATEGGRTPYSAGAIKPYLEHRQFG